MVALKKMVATIVSEGGATQKYYFMSNPLLYTSIGKDVGIALSPTTDKQVVHRVEDLLLYGVLTSLMVQTGTTALNRKSTKILCAIDKAKIAQEELIEKTIPQGVIISISANLKAEYYLP